MRKFVLRTGLLLFLGSSLFMSSCTDETLAVLEELLESEFSTGWFGETENLGELESDINLGSDNESLPSKVDLDPYFPPVGDQGQYGTCVSWALGYYLKTALEAQDQGIGTSALASAGNQFSPKDLFWAIPNSEKGSGCDGTYFEAAFDVMVSRGIARMSTVPYTNLGDCGSTPPSSWTSEANQNRIENYRKIPINVNEIKSYLANNRPIGFGARLGDDFMAWNSEAVIDSDIPTNGQHGYHAMVAVGYDDSKGPRGAFRVKNSWSEGWGDGGFIWVDYDYFVSDFCFGAFVAKNSPGPDFNPDEDNDGTVDPDDKVNGQDLIAWNLDDFENTDASDPRVRSITYNVFNIGDQTIRASEDWNIVYVLYNAYDANDYTILLYDYYSNDYGRLGEDNALDEGPGISGNWWNHVDVKGGQSVAQAVAGDDYEGSFSWGYTMPSNVNGDYYLVLIADGYDDIDEEDESNNFLFFTQENGDPVRVVNGEIRGNFGGGRYGTDNDRDERIVRKPVAGDQSPKPTAVTEHHRNTYTPGEIRTLLMREKESGNLERKIKAFEASQMKKTR